MTVTELREAGSEKGVFWKRGLFRKVHFLEILENLEILEDRQTMENKGESDHFLEILDSRENLEILEIPESFSEKTPFVMTPFSGPEKKVTFTELREAGPSRARLRDLVNLFLTNLVRISGFSSLFLAIAVLSAHFPREC